MRGDTLDAREHVLDLAREHVRSADDEHVVAARADLLHTRMRAAAAALLGNDARQVVRTVAKHRDAFFVERRQNELAHLAFRHGLAGHRVDDLPQEMVLGYVLHIALSKALARHARPHDLGQPVVVGAHDVHAVLDFRLERRRAGLAAEKPDAQRRLLPIVAHLFPHLANMERVGGRRDDHSRTVVLDHLDMALGVARTRRNHRAAKLHAAVMEAETAGEHAVAERHLHAIARDDARHAGKTRDAVAPNGHVMLGVADDNRLARRSRGRVHLDDLVERLGEKPIGERLAQRVLIGEGKLADIFERLDVLGRNAHLVHLVAIPRHVLVGVGNLSDQLLKLDRADALAARGFHGAVEHGKHVEIPRVSSLEGGAFHGGIEYLFSGTVHYHHNFLKRLRNEMRKIILAQKLNGLAFEHPLGGSDIVHREDDIRADERIAVRYVDVAVGDDSHNARELAGRVLQAKHEHLGLRAGGVLVAKHRERRIGIIDDEAHDAVIAGIGSAVAANVDARLDEGIEHANQMAGLAFDEDADLGNAHKTTPSRLFRGKRGTQLERLEVDIEILLGNARGDDPVPHLCREAEGARERTEQHDVGRLRGTRLAGKLGCGNEHRTRIAQPFACILRH